MSLLSMSLAGTLIILVTAVVRALAVDRLPKGTFLALWWVALVRLLVPYTLPFALNIYSLARRLDPAKAAPINAPAAPIAHVVPVPHVVLTAPAGPTPAVPAVDPYTAVWLAGAAVCGFVFLLAYGWCRREFKTSLPVDDAHALELLAGQGLRRRVSLRRSDKISAPLTYGVLRPVILLPKSTDWSDREALEYVLAHECIHIRRFDAVTKLVLTATVCVHWFNPAVWAMYVLANRDLELSCDEAVVRRFGAPSRAGYAMALIRMEETRSGLRPLCNHFSKNAIEERIVAIMKIKKTSLAALIAAVVLVAAVIVAFATSSVPNDPPRSSATVAFATSSVPNDPPRSSATVPVTLETPEPPMATSAEPPSQEELLAEYAKFGISYQDGLMRYNGKRVGMFVDGVEMSDGAWTLWYSHTDYRGGLSLVTVRERKDNGDGSYDPFGPLTGIRTLTDSEVDALYGVSSSNQKAVSSVTAYAIDAADSGDLPALRDA